MRPVELKMYQLGFTCLSFRDPYLERVYDALLNFCIRQESWSVSIPDAATFAMRETGFEFETVTTHMGWLIDKGFMLVDNDTIGPNGFKHGQQY